MIDTPPPASQIEALPTSQTRTWFFLDWMGSDDLSGLGSCDIQYRRGPGGAWTHYTTVPAGTTHVLFVAAYGNHNQTYYFRSQATDAAGNAESYPTGYDAYTTTGWDDSGLSRSFLSLIMKGHTQ